MDYDIPVPIQVYLLFKQACQITSTNDCLLELELIPGQFFLSIWSESQQNTLEPVLATLCPRFPLLLLFQLLPAKTPACCILKYWQALLLEKSNRSSMCPVWCVSELTSLLTLFLVLASYLMFKCQTTPIDALFTQGMGLPHPTLQTPHFQEVPMQILIFTNVQQ